MIICDGGYSAIQFNTTSLRETVQRLSLAVPKMMRDLEADAIVVTGKSGISLAFALKMLIDVPVVVVRKKGENSHGSSIEGDGFTDVQKYIVLDDFVSSGATVRQIQQDMYDRAAVCNGHVVCVGVLEYHNYEGNWTADGCDLYAQRDSGCLDVDVYRL